MKTADQLQAMSKSEIDAYGNEALGVDLDSRRTKQDMIEDILQIQEDRIAAHEALHDPIMQSDSAIFRIARFPGSDVRLIINGRQFDFQVGIPRLAPRYISSTLDNVPGLKYTME